MEQLVKYKTARVQASPMLAFLMALVEEELARVGATQMFFHAAKGGMS